MTEQKITKDYIRQMVTTNDQWATRAIIALYQCQTDDEQMAEVTKHTNGVGFSGVDAGFLSSLAKQAQARPLSEKQLAAAKKLLGKYAGQLLKIAEAKAAVDEHSQVSK